VKTHPHAHTHAHRHAHLLKKKRGSSEEIRKSTRSKEKKGELLFTSSVQRLSKKQAIETNKTQKLKGGHPSMECIKSKIEKVLRIKLMQKPNEAKSWRRCEVKNTHEHI
jgi:hypothetical protein